MVNKWKHLLKIYYLSWQQQQKKKENIFRYMNNKLREKAKHIEHLEALIATEMIDSQQTFDGQRKCHFHLPFFFDVKISISISIISYFCCELIRSCRSSYFHSAVGRGCCIISNFATFSYEISSSSNSSLTANKFRDIKIYLWEDLKNENIKIHELFNEQK